MFTLGMRRGAGLFSGARQRALATTAMAAIFALAGAGGAFAQDYVDGEDRAAPVTLNGGTTTLTVEPGATATQSGLISETITSQLDFTGAADSTLILTDAGNSWTGPSYILNGMTLQGTSSSISSSVIHLSDYSTLSFVQSASGSFNPDIDGAGYVTVAGQGAGQTLTFTGLLSHWGGITGGVDGHIGIGAAGSYLLEESVPAVNLQGAGSSLNNAGDIVLTLNTDSYSAAVNADVAATVTNSGLISRVRGGGVWGEGYAVQGANGLLTLNNSGTISSEAHGVRGYAGATIDNSGTITAGGTGVEIDGGLGSVTNQASGFITAIGISGDGVIFGAGGSVDNSGEISATGGRAIAVSGASVTIQNSGLLLGATRGLELNAGGEVTNESAGEIVGGSDAAIFMDAATTITNRGRIASSGAIAIYQSSGAGTTEIVNESGATIETGAANQPAIDLYNLADIDNSGLIEGGDGVWIDGGGKITNRSGGQILGRDTLGVWFYAAPAEGVEIDNSGEISGLQIGVQTDFDIITKLTNAGTITGHYGVIDASFGRAIQLSGGADEVTLNAGSVINGAIMLDGGDDTLIFNAGAVNGDIVGGGGADTFSFGNGATANGVVFGEDGADTFIVGGGSALNFGIDAGGGDDDLTISASLTGDISGGGDDDEITIADGVIVTAGAIGGNDGDDIVTLLGGVTTDYGLYGGVGGADTLTLAGTAARTVDFTEFDEFETLVKAGGGTLTLAGDSSLADELNAFIADGGETNMTGGSAMVDAAAVTVNAGAAVTSDVSETIGSLAGAGNFEIQSGALTTGGDGSDTIFAGVLSGDGGLTKEGAGVFTLTGANTYLGATTVNAGTLVVNGSIVSSLTLGAGGRLMGSGSLGGVTATGTVAPGNSIGTLAVNGAFTFATGSTYEVEIASNGTSDLVAATGAVTIQTGAAVDVLALDPLVSYQGGQEYTIVTGSGVTGTFSTLNDSAFIDTELSYTASAVRLRIVPVAVPPAPPGAPQPAPAPVTGFPTAAATLNQSWAATGASFLGQTGDPLAVYNSILPMNTAQARAAFDAISGEIHASARHAVVEGARLFQSALSRRAGSLFGGEGGFAEDLVEGAAVWGAMLGEAGDVEADGNAADLEHTFAGAAFGAEGGTAAPGGTVTGGVAAGFLDGRGSVDGRASAGEISSWHGGLHGAWDNGAARVSGAATYAQAEIDSTRMMGWAGLAPRSATARRDAETFGVELEAAYRLPFSTAAFSLAPVAVVEYFTGSADAAQETGAGALDLAIAGKDYARLDAGFGFVAGHDRGGVSFEARAVYLRNLTGATPLQALALAGAPAAQFPVLGPDTGADRIELGAGLGAGIAPRLNLTARYDASLSADGDAHRASIALQWGF